MIRWNATPHDGRRMIGLGLEAGNVERLVNGQPILVRGETLGLPHDIIIYYGATKAQMIDELREQGADEAMIAEAENSSPRRVRAMGSLAGLRRIYVASSWRCQDQPRVVALLRGAGHEVYDFRNPAPGNKGFAWSDIDPQWLGWEPAVFAKLLAHPVAQSGFAFDKQALDWCDTCVLVLPCGRSAHLEAGYTAGQGKPTIFYLSPDKFEPELMYLLGSGCVTTDDELLVALSKGSPDV